MDAVTQRQNQQQGYLSQTFADLSDLRSMHALLNCYCREVAGPAGEMEIGSRFGEKSWPQSLRQSVLTKGKVLQVHLPESDSWIVISIANRSVTLNFRYISEPYYKTLGRSWVPLDCKTLATLLLKTMARRYGEPFNIELQHQVLKSHHVIKQIVENSNTPIHWGEGEEAYIQSEQALSFGHVFHPTPKSREGFSHQDVLRYSPEIGVSFPLHYFAVQEDDLLQESIIGQTAQDILERDDSSSFTLNNGQIGLPVHPWQASFLQQQPVIQQAIKTGRIRSLGEGEKTFYPTSSVRTLYQPGNPYFYKFSLHVRLTNCVRKNAIYELESATQLSALLTHELEELAIEFPSISVLIEPAFISLAFGNIDKQDSKLVTEGFGLLFRDGLSEQLKEGATPLLAASLFSQDLYGQTPVIRYVQKWADLSKQSLFDATIGWFDLYLKQLMYPMFHSLFHHGVVFEPHLQNVVIGINQGLPEKIFIRDLEGTKLLQERWPLARLGHMSEAAQKSVYYSRERGWNRIAYCLLINNLFQAVFCLANGNAHLEVQLWQVFRARIADYQTLYGNPFSHSVIQSLLAGDSIPYKTNFLTRVFKRADRESQYVRLPNPLAIHQPSLF